MYRSLAIESQTKWGAIAEKLTDYSVCSSWWGRYDLD
jgi:hypothetical protein